SGSTLYDQVTGNSGIQEWVLLYSGRYRIEAAGAEGGTSTEGAGGRGAILKGEFELTAGTTLFIAVGQQGLASSYAGGGGGSFVAHGTSLSNSLPLIVAGGGASRGQGSGDVSSYLDASLTTSGRDGNQYGTAMYPSGGTGGNGGNGGTGYCPGGGGGGFYGNAIVNFTESGYLDNYGRAFRNGAIGGDFSSYDGGFGCGGAGYDNGGGGGGYSGGGAGSSSDSSYDRGGGGGGSYNLGENTSDSSTLGYNYGNGYVTITCVNCNNFWPDISSIDDQTTNEDTAISSISFTVTDVETADCGFDITFASSDTTVIPIENISYTCNS
ncbi:hypothetical protein MHK_001145, partial [Candidatus Magnetomorum sp. HK-1]